MSHTLFFAPDSSEGNLLNKIKVRLDAQRNEYEQLKQENEAEFKKEFDPLIFSLKELIEKCRY